MSFCKYHTKVIESSDRNFIYSLFHKGLGLVYLSALSPLFFQVDVLIGKNGLEPACELLKATYAEQGFFDAFMQFPSLYHLLPADITLYVLIAVGCAGALLLMLNRIVFFGAILAWISFLSITTIGGDFFVIIIDLFLAEVGFLALFSTYFLEKRKVIPNIVAYAFVLLNFRLWFCMGINKFYMPDSVWANFTFFDYFFHAQPMPTPLSPIFNQTPKMLKYVAIVCVFMAEIIIPFFVFGSRKFRLMAFVTFLVTSILIQINGNYGYFNVLSIVVALLILKDNDISFFNNKTISSSAQIKVSRAAKIILSAQIALQLFYCVYVFNPTPHSPQNHFNYIFTNIKTENRLANNLLSPFRWMEYWRICNPYGVFRSIPHYHGEIRFSGSHDGKEWKTYEFKFLPSGNTDYLGFYAPYYPRLDHLMFYETLAAQNYRWNPLNHYYNESNAWVCNFVNKLIENDKQISNLLKKNPFENQRPPSFIKAEIFRLHFSNEEYKNWFSKPMYVQKIYSADEVCRKPIITYEEAMLTTYSKAE